MNAPYFDDSDIFVFAYLQTNYGRDQLVRRGGLTIQDLQPQPVTNVLVRDWHDAKNVEWMTHTLDKAFV